MARIYEKPRFVDSFGDPPARTYHFGVSECPLESTARSLAMTTADLVITTPHGTLFRGEMRLSQTAFDQWDVDIDYQSRPYQLGEWTFNWDTTGGTVTRQFSLETIAKYPSATAPSYDQAIDVQGDEIKGVDVVSPQMRFSLTIRHPLGVLSPNYAKLMQGITGKVNSTPFLQWAAGEVLFLGASGADGRQTEASCRYDFAVSPNVTGLTIGSVTGVAKKGWELIWVKFKDETKTVSSTTYIVKVPQFVYVERVYETADLAGIIGVAL